MRVMGDADDFLLMDLNFRKITIRGFMFNQSQSSEKYLSCLTFNVRSSFPDVALKQ